jgi:hypothetical protein
MTRDSQSLSDRSASVAMQRAWRALLRANPTKSLAELPTYAEFVEDEVDRLRAAIEEYCLWEPGRRGHAAAHRRLREALNGGEAT